MMRRRRSLRGVALDRKSWLFCGSDSNGQRAAAMYSLILTVEKNGVDPQTLSPTLSTASQRIPLNGSTSCCLGTGAGQM
jgi:hypothetical protein